MKKIEFAIALDTEYSCLRDFSAEIGLHNGKNAVLIDLISPGATSNDRAALTADDAEFIAICLQRMATALRNPT